MAQTIAESPTTELTDQTDVGVALRADVPRRSHGDWGPAADRPDPVELLRSQDDARSADLVPIRHGRMATSAFAFYRGGAAIMAADLATVPTTGLVSQICGDAHLSNLGVFATPERQLLFDLNDFDETLPGPWEWDLKRLAASFTIAARSNGLGKREDSEATLACVEAYRTAMADFAESTALDTWYARINVDETLEKLRQTAPKKDLKRSKENIAKARSRTSVQAARKLTTVVDGRLRIIDDPPIVMPLSTVVPADRVEQLTEGITDSYRQYRESLPAGPRFVLEDYEVVDIAHKVVGVGSVGLRAFIGLLQSRRTGEPLLLQMKEATASVLEPHLGPSPFDQPGRRVVEGQRMMQAASDIFLGWSTSMIDGRHYYWRQLRDMKSSTEVERLSKAGLTIYARLCGWSLARAHARSGSPVAIAGYLGTSDRFDRAIAEFARRYATQNDADFEAHAQAIADGVIPAISGV